MCNFELPAFITTWTIKLPGAELKIVFGPVHRNWGQCDRLFDEKIYPVASQHIVDSLHTPENFLDNRLIQVPNHQVTWSQVLREVGLNGTFGEQFCSADSTEMALSLASAGYGIALARFPTTDFLVKKLGLVKCPLVPMIKSTEAYYLVYQSQQSLSKYAHYFRIWLIDSASQYTQN
ncbi:MAG: hypothetical protein GKR95_06800 [Gammaproteobacteria bacterium]|nr:hypothetical protein [Gammaproteobacteria bacterium]